MPHRSDWWRALGSVGVLSLAMTLIVPTFPSASANSSLGPSWHARVAVAGDFKNLSTWRGNLFAVRFATRGPVLAGTRLDKIDPVSGQVDAESPVLPDIGAPQFVDGGVWVMGTTRSGATESNGAPSVLSELSPSTLRPVRTFNIGSSTSTGGLFVADRSGNGSVFWTAHEGGTGACTVSRISPSNGNVLFSRVLTKPRDPCAALALDGSGRFLYVIPQAVDTGTVFKLNAVTGREVAVTHFPVFSEFVYSMVATSHRLWIAGGDPGAPGWIVYLSDAPLKVLGHSKSADRGGGTMPSFGEFPRVDLSRGVVWVGSAGNIACFGPGTQVPRSLSAQGPRYPIITDSFVVARNEAWANADFGGPRDGLVRLQPPAACR